MWVQKGQESWILFSDWQKSSGGGVVEVTSSLS